MKLVLASSSERRRHLLLWLDVPFEVVVSEFDESLIEESDPEKLVKKLALEKAKVVARDLKNCLIIGADTVVAIDNEIIGKPKSEEDAVRILEKLSGKTHEVYTGVAVISRSVVSRPGLGKIKTGSYIPESCVGAERTEVAFRELSDKEIRDYVATGEPLDKGGAYAIQMGAAGFVKSVKGSYTNVVGLPLLLLKKLLEKQGFTVNKDVSKIVFEETGYWS